MVSGKAVLTKCNGLNLKPAARFSKAAQGFASSVTITNRSTTANAKSILSVLGACVRRGDEVEIVCSGEDEEEALETLLDMIREGVGEN